MTISSSLSNPRPPSAHTPLLLQSSWNDTLRIAATTPGDARSITYRYNPDTPKPGIHPLVTPRGHVLTGWEMSDHVWHRGLWFTIKFINKDNFWEERAPFGRQVTHAGQPVLEPVAADAARIMHTQQWISPAGEAVMDESRVVYSKLQDDGVTLVDWDISLRALRDVILDRTPFTTWGGYGGFSLRASRGMHGVDFLLPDGTTVPSISGDPHPWVVMQGRMDGGADERVSVCMIDHPENPVAPVPWYAKSANGFTFINAAFLFHGSLNAGAGETLRFRYRLLYRDGLWNTDEAAALAAGFRKPFAAA
ncbi:PmoA family protein [Geminisphaera colitermitum]|uniref:DUF6807 domain-containing protein n=1 Tax=Geminisphaera colitermitum TaxID=1148786 RepID=UPI000158D25C|nr:PmoA family protein [Geminisphaera colitermitum]